LVIFFQFQAASNFVLANTYTIVLKVGLGLRSSFICQGTSTRRQRRNLCGLRVKLPPVTTSQTTHR